MMTDYRRAFKIACELLNGATLYGVDADKIFEIMMAKDGVVSNDSYEEYILNHLQELDQGQYAIKALEQESKVGHWIKISPANIYECSECGQNVMTQDICAYKFCHGCGAKMVEPQESENS